MGQLKVNNRDLLKCRGFDVAPCFHCKRHDPEYDKTIVSELVERNARNYCEHIVL